MSLDDNVRRGSQEQTVYCSNRQGTVTLSELMQPGTQQPDIVMYPETGTSHCVSNQTNVEYDFFDKEEQKRREEYRNRVEKHYCRLIEEERLSPESASFLSDAFAEAEVRAKYGNIGPRSKGKVEYHTGIDKTVWREVDHQRSKSLERLKSHHSDNMSDNMQDKDSQLTGNLSFNVDSPRDSLQASMDRTYSHNDSNSSLWSTGQLDTGQTNIGNQSNNMDYHDRNSEQHSEIEVANSDQGSTICDDEVESNKEDYITNVTALTDSQEYSFTMEDEEGDKYSGDGLHDKPSIKSVKHVQNDSWDIEDIGSRNYGDGEDSSETLNLESEEEHSDTDDEFDFGGSGQREWVNRRGDMAVEKSMGVWLGSPRTGAEGQDVYKEHMRRYKEKVAAKQRGRMTKLLKDSSSQPNASPTQVDYDADEEVSGIEAGYSSTHSLDRWSDSQLDFDDDEVSEKVVPNNEATVQTYDFMQKPRSSRSSVSSERNRVDHSTYQSYTAGLLHSSGKSEKFLKLQKHFAVLERITALEERERVHGTSEEIDESADLFAKYDVQSREELEWLYQELNEARRNEEFFYDLQRLEVYQWKPSKDFGLKKKGKSLNDLRRVYEQTDYDGNDEINTSMSDSFFISAMKAEKQKLKDMQAIDNEIKPRHTVEMKSGAQTHPRLMSRPLYGTNIPEKLDDYEIIVEAKKQMNKSGNAEHLHVRCASSPYSNALEEESHMGRHKRSGSSKGALLSKPLDRHDIGARPKPTVAEVTPVPRPGKLKSRAKPNILSGPHDFASRVSNTEAVARPMQSNMQIYNSLENPQYQAHVTFDEGIPARKLSRGRSNENFTIQKDADGNFIVISTDRNQNRSPSSGALDTNRSRRPSCIESPMSETIQERNESKHPSNEHSDKDYVISNRLDEPDVGEVDMHPLSQTDLGNLPDISRHPPAPPKRSGIDKSRINSVQTAVRSFEHKQTADPKPASHMQRSRTVPDLLANQSELRHRKQEVPVSCEESYHPKPWTPITGQKFDPQALQDMSHPPAFTNTSQSSTTRPSFKVRDLRSLAQNNEFCQSNFFPKGKSGQSVNNGDPVNIKNAPHAPINKKHTFLHTPVSARVFQPKDKVPARRMDENRGTGYETNIDKYAVTNVPVGLDRRRHSTSSTDTFIVKDSEDEIEDVPLNATYTKDNFNYARSKSQPDMSESEEPIRPRSSKSAADLSSGHGRNSLPRTVSGNLNDIQHQFQRKFSDQTNKFSKNKTAESSKHGLESDAPDMYDSYMPSEDIVRDMMRSKDLYKKTEPKERQRTPSDISTVTLEYLQDIGHEWNESKHKNTDNNAQYPGVKEEAVTLPTIEHFIGSDTGVSPNRWVPVLETKKENVVNKVEPDVLPESAQFGLESSIYSPQPGNESKKLFDPDLNKYQTLPKRPKSSKGGRAITYTTIPRMRPDASTNKARDAQSANHANSAQLGLGNGKRKYSTCG